MKLRRCVRKLQSRAPRADAFTSRHPGAVALSSSLIYERNGVDGLSLLDGPRVTSQDWPHGPSEARESRFLFLIYHAAPPRVILALFFLPLFFLSSLRSLLRFSPPPLSSVLPLVSCFPTLELPRRPPLLHARRGCLRSPGTTGIRSQNLILLAP